MKNMQITKRLKSLFISQPMDYEYLTIAMLLLGIGLIMLLSSSFPSALYEKKDPYFFARKQAIIAAGGVVIMLAMSKVDYHILRYFAKALLIASVILLAIVLIPNPNVSHLANNSRRWLEIGGFSFQPSEMVKLAIVIDFAASIARKKEKMKTFRYGILPYVGKLCVVCGLNMIGGKIVDIFDRYTWYFDKTSNANIPSESLQRYIDEINSIPPLSENEEQRLISLIAEGSNADSSLSKYPILIESDKEYDHDEYRRLRQLSQEGKAAKDKLVIANLRKVPPIAEEYKVKYARFNVSIDDLISEGNIGLMRAAEHCYDSGVSFQELANTFIRLNIIIMIRRIQHHWK